MVNVTALAVRLEVKRMNKISKNMGVTLKV